MLGLLSSKPASPHFRDCGKHFTLPFLITWVGRSEMRWCETQCVDRKADDPESLYTFSLCIITWFDQRRPQLPANEASGPWAHLHTPKSFVAWAHSHVPDMAEPCYLLVQTVVEERLWRKSCLALWGSALPLLGGHFYAQALATHLSYVAGTPVPGLTPS